jgi:catechol 2,3-dioxygenase-like lactoylglutathione lyase family enzyme
MSRLLYAIAYTHDLGKSKAFYRDRVGLTPGSQSPFWVDFGTRGAAFALLAVDGSTRREVGLCFAVESIEAHVARLRARGVALAGDIRDEPFGRLVSLRDPDGNALSFLEPARPSTRGGNDVALFVRLHSDEPGALASFYRDRLGFEVAAESPAAMEFETGETRLTIQPRPLGEDLPSHATLRLAVGFEYEALDPAADAMRERGLMFSAAPAAEEEGVFAEVLDPDGHLIVFREPAPEPTLEEQLAEAFVDDETPHLVAIRKPVRKGSKATSFVAVKPNYTVAKKAQKKKAEAKVLTRALSQRVREKAAVASPRGTGPAGSRAKPKRKADARRAKVKPATGRLKKAERKVAQRKKRATASASKAKPVKRAVVKRAAPKRGKRR